MLSALKRDQKDAFSIYNSILFFSACISILLLTIYIAVNLHKSATIRDQNATTSKIRDDINRILETDYSNTVTALAKQPTVIDSFSEDDQEMTQLTNMLLNSTREILDANLVYILNTKGTVTASSFSPSGTTLFGNNYRFRPYFKNALGGKTSSYPALGITTDKRGLYFSSPIVNKENEIIGVAVIKGGFDAIDRRLTAASVEGPLVITTPSGVIFSSSESSWLFTTITELNRAVRISLIDSGQFGLQPLQPLGVVAPLAEYGLLQDAPVQRDRRRDALDGEPGESLPTGLEG